MVTSDFIGLMLNLKKLQNYMSDSKQCTTKLSFISYCLIEFWCEYIPYTPSLVLLLTKFNTDYALKIVRYLFPDSVEEIIILISIHCT